MAIKRAMTRKQVVEYAQANNYGPRDEIIRQIKHIRWLLSSLETNTDYFPETELITAAVMDLRDVADHYVQRQVIR